MSSNYLEPSRKKMSRYKIKILTLQGVTLHFTVSSYKIIEGDFISFVDEKTNKKKIFHASRAEIDEVSYE